MIFFTLRRVVWPPFFVLSILFAPVSHKRPNPEYSILNPHNVLPVNLLRSYSVRIRRFRGPC